MGRAEAIAIRIFVENAVAASSVVDHAIAVVVSSVSADFLFRRTDAWSVVVAVCPTNLGCSFAICIRIESAIDEVLWHQATGREKGGEGQQFLNHERTPRNGSEIGHEIAALSPV